MTDVGNGYPRWRDLDERERRLREDHDGDFQRFEDSIRHTLERAHTFHHDLAVEQGRSIEDLVKRIDAVESVLDQQRGARSLAYFLMGTNVLLAVSVIGTILHLGGIL